MLYPNFPTAWRAVLERERTSQKELGDNEDVVCETNDGNTMVNKVTNEDCMETADGIIALYTTIGKLRTSLISYIMRIYNENCGIGEEPTRSSSKLTRRDNKPKIVQGQPK